jgi:hypothetical protein
VFRVENHKHQQYYLENCCFDGALIAAYILPFRVTRSSTRYGIGIPVVRRQITGTFAVLLSANEGVGNIAANMAMMMILIRFRM